MLVSVLLLVKAEEIFLAPNREEQIGCKCSYQTQAKQQRQGDLCNLKGVVFACCICQCTGSGTGRKAEGEA